MGRRPGDPVFQYTNKDSPDYKPQYGKTYTARQQAILDEQLPLEEVRATELLRTPHPKCMLTARRGA